jgi:hypothetical protein
MHRVFVPQDPPNVDVMRNYVWIQAGIAIYTGIYINANKSKNANMTSLLNSSRLYENDNVSIS